MVPSRLTVMAASLARGCRGGEFDTRATVAALARKRGSVAAYLELHIEQGPILDEEKVQIGVVESVQGISWTEYTVTGVSNHAGTTPMRLRRDAGYLAASVNLFARKLAWEMGGDQVATVGSLALRPNLINVVPNRAVFSVDLRNTDEAKLKEAEARVAARAASSEQR